MQDKIQQLKENIGQRFVGKEQAVHDLITVMLAGGHILVEDVPGVGKTTLAKALANSVKADFGRIQFTPDTLPTDVVGTSVFNPKTLEFQVVKGPIHNQIILADEINRTPPRSQSALLEAMEEHQVTIDKTTYKLPEFFMVIATQNPTEQLGTYPLPEAQLDRFMIKMSLGYPEKQMQLDLAKKFLDGKFDGEMKPVLTAEEVVAIKQEVKKVIIKDEVIEYALAIVDATRELPELEYGLSPRAGLDLLASAKANAYLDGRDFVIPEDVIAMSKAVLPHRMVLTAKAKMDKYTGRQLIVRVADSIKRPM